MPTDTEALIARVRSRTARCKWCELPMCLQPDEAAIECHVRGLTADGRSRRCEMYIEDADRYDLCDALEAAEAERDALRERLATLRLPWVTGH